MLSLYERKVAMVLEYRLDHHAVLSMLPDRKADSHKGDYGRILLLCGSRGFTGAAALAAMGALRVGAGLVYLAVPESIYTIEATRLLEPIVIPLPDHEGGLSEASWQAIERVLPKMDAVLFGPGLGSTPGVSYVLGRLLCSYQGPLILDADGINCLPQHIDLLRGREAPVVITPHQGEFDRLRGCSCADRIDDATTVARELGIIVVLKGHRTIITDGVDIYVNETGNPGMAVGGSGDVLAGMVAGLIGQSLQPIQSASMAAWIHGAAGDICAAEMGQYGILPSDMLSVIPRLMK